MKLSKRPAMADSLFNEDGFRRLAAACDRLLTGGVGTARTAVECLHLLNQHPTQLEKYSGLAGVFGTPVSAPGRLKEIRDRLFNLAYKTAALARNFWRCGVYAAHRARVDFEDLPINRVDVIFVSWLVNKEHITEADDFYFGPMQKDLADRGLSSLLVWRNQTGKPSLRLGPLVWRSGRSARILLPDVAGWRAEIKYFRQALAVKAGLRRAARSSGSPGERETARFAAKQAFSHATVANLRLEDQVTAICRRLKPLAVITLYEGHAWERLVNRGARAADEQITVIGYQHTILQRLAHSVFRPLGAGSGCDPDIILTLGEVTADMLAKSPVAADSRVMVHGTHRQGGRISRREPGRKPVFLVLPEGIEGECVTLFNFALECASRLPQASFIFRMHPVLPFDRVAHLLAGGGVLPDNVTVSKLKSIEDDFNRAGCLLYRGSSTALYGVTAGLKPYYLARPGEMSIDPLFELGAWREKVTVVDELVGSLQSYLNASADIIGDHWRRAADYCEHYSVAVNEMAKDRLEAVIRRQSDVYDGVSKRNSANSS